jgi:hypothetical protein
MAGWRYLLYQMNGDGTETLLHPGLPLSDPQLTRALSTPHQITGTLSVPKVDLIREDGTPLIKRWRTAVYAEQPDQRLWIGGVVADYDINGPQLTLDVAGLTAYAAGTPYEGPPLEKVQVDPLDMVRLVWDYIQTQPGGNIGLVVDSAKSTVRIGEARKDVDFTTGSGDSVDFTAGPIMLNAWSTDDLGAKVDEWAKAVPFDYLEHHEWIPGQEWPRHRLQLGWPAIGVRRDELRFVLGENVFKMPAESLPGEDIVTGVIVQGAGEGKDRIRGAAHAAPKDSLRRVKTITDKKITTVADANKRAAEELTKYAEDRPGAGIVELVIRDHVNAMFGTYDVGDEIPYVGDHDWGPVEVWVKIVKMTIAPESSLDVVATVVRTDTIRS